jgi:GAF domain-containing protein
MGKETVMGTPNSPTMPFSLTEDKRRPSEGPRREADRQLVAVLEERLRFEQLLAETSSRFVDVAFDQVDAEIADALGAVAAHLGADLATVMQIDERSEKLRHSHEWWDSSFDFDRSFLRLNLAEEAPWIRRTIVQGEPVAINKLDDFPLEAANEKRISTDWGIRSVLWVPFQVSGEFLGCIALNTLREETTWSAEVIRRLQLVGQVFGSAIARKRYRRELDDRLRFEQLVADVSSVFVSLPPSAMDVGIEDALRRLGGFFGVDRVFIAQFSEESARSGPTHGWYARGIEPDPFLQGAVFPEQFTWMAKRILGNDALVVHRFEDLPPEAAAERDYVQRIGIQTSLLLPLAGPDAVLGVVILDAIQTPRFWSDERVQRMRLVGEIFANALLRKRAEEALTLALTEVRRLKERLEEENVYLRQEIERAADGGDRHGEGGSRPGDPQPERT